MPVHIVPMQPRRQRELTHQRLQCSLALRCRIFFHLQLALHNKPANLVRPRLLRHLVRRIGICSRIKEQHRELRCAPCDEVKRIFAGNEDQAVGDKNARRGKAQEFVKIGQVWAGRGHTGKLREG